MVKRRRQDGGSKSIQSKDNDDRMNETKRLGRWADGGDC